MYFDIIKVVHRISGQTVPSYFFTRTEQILKSSLKIVWTPLLFTMHQQQFLLCILVNHFLIHYVVRECVRGGGIVCILFFLLFGLLAFKLENVSVKHSEVIFARLLWFEQEKKKNFGNSNTNIWTRILNICQSLSGSCTHQWHTSVTCTRKVRVLAPYLKREQFFPHDWN